MSFDDYLTSNLGTYKDDLNKEQVAFLKSLYDKLLIWQNTANIALQKGLDSKREVDYTNDYEKAMAQVSDASQKLAAAMAEIKQNYGIEELEDNAKHSM
jgi:hypothetical protein